MGEKLSNYGLPLSFGAQQKLPWRKYEAEEISAKIEKLFNKNIDLDNSNCELPNIDTLFTEDPWQVDELQKIKHELNNTKCQLNDFDIVAWRAHTKKRNVAEDVKWRLRRYIHPEFVTQAWCKFYELLSSCSLIPDESKIINKKCKTIHLCEAPGAFVASLNHWMKLNRPKITWDWTATTLNPYYEGNSLSFMLNDDRFIIHTLNHWYFGADNTGDLMRVDNLNGFINYEKKNKDEIILITADGSIDCINVPDEQETIVSHLLFCETITALHLLSIRGNYVIKMFTIFEYKTICLIYLLSCCFEKISFKKPATSKSGNSEVYVICMNFKGLQFVESHLQMTKKYFETASNCAMFRKCDIPSSFIKQLIHVGEFFKSHQCDVILSNIRSFNPNSDEYFAFKKMRSAVADAYFDHCGIAKLANDLKIVDVNKLLDTYYYSLYNRVSCGSYNERQKKGKMEPRDQLMMLVNELNSIYGTDKIYSLQYENKFDDIQIIIGAPYTEIQSSKFCESHVLKIYNSIMKLNLELSLKLLYPDDKSCNDFFEKHNFTKILNYHYDLSTNNLQLITDIYETIVSLQSGKSLILLGYSLLSQFNVGLLHILIHAFDHVDMELNEDLGCIITLCNYVDGIELIQLLQIILEALRNAQSNGKMVLSVVPIIKVYEDKTYRIVVEINHMIIKFFSQKIGKFL